MFMPTATSLGFGGTQGSIYYISIKDPVPGGPTTRIAYTGNVGLGANAELDYVSIDDRPVGSLKALNISFLLSAGQSDTNVAVGVYNALGDSYLNGNTQPSPFVAIAHTSSKGRRYGPQQPTYRLHAGYGTRLHDGVFGGLEYFLASSTSLFATHYALGETYGIAFRAGSGDDAPVLKFGSIGGDRFWALSYRRIFY